MLGGGSGVRADSTKLTLDMRMYTAAILHIIGFQSVDLDCAGTAIADHNNIMSSQLFVCGFSIDFVQC